MLALPLIVDTDVNRAVQVGDLLAGGERLTPIANAAGVTITANNLLGGIINRTLNAGPVTDTFDNAINMISQILAGIFRGTGTNTPRGFQQGTTFRVLYINSGAGVVTFAAGTNVTLTNMGTLAATSVREMLITLANTNDASIAPANTTNASAVITGMSTRDTQRVSTGMAVSGTGIPGGATVLSVQPGVGVTLSANATATGSLVALTFSPVITVTGLGTYPL
jgi:hypothetical protein